MGADSITQPITTRWQPPLACSAVPVEPARRPAPVQTVYVPVYVPRPVYPVRAQAPRRSRKVKTVTVPDYRPRPRRQRTRRQAQTGNNVLLTLMTFGMWPAVLAVTKIVKIALGIVYIGVRR